MGCDIHTYVETRRNGTWHCVPPKNAGREWDKLDWSLRRNYALFAILGNSGQNTRFYWALTDPNATPEAIAALQARPDLYYVPVAQSRGIPDDVSATLRTHRGFRPDDTDEHSHSWLTLAELQAFDWEQHKVFVDSLSETQRVDPKYMIRKLGERDESMLEIIAQSEKTPEMQAKFEAERNDWIFYKDTVYSMTYRSLLDPDFAELGVQMQLLIPDGGTAADVRIVYFFDN